MTFLVLNEEDKDKAIKKGATFLCKQGSAFLMKLNEGNFEKIDFVYVLTKDIDF